MRKEESGGVGRVADGDVAVGVEDVVVVEDVVCGDEVVDNFFFRHYGGMNIVGGFTCGRVTWLEEVSWD